MAIAIQCPCSAKLRVIDTLAGLEVQCPKCQEVHPVPGAKPLAKSGLSAAERERLEDELEKGERLLWAAKPDPKGPFVMGWLGAAGCFGIALVLLVIAVLTYVQKVGGVMSFVLGVMAVLLVGFGVALPFVNRVRYARTAYALTDRRALVWDCDWVARPRFTDYGPEDLAACKRLQFSQAADAVGHLLFAREVTGKVGRGKVIRSHGFFYVAGVGAVEKLLREALIDAYTDRLMG